MGLLIFVVILVIAAFIGLGFKLEKTSREVIRYGEIKTIESEELTWKLNKLQFLSILPCLILLFGVFTRIPANSVGIQYSTFSGVKEDTLTEGMHTKSIFDKIYVISTEVQTKNLKDITGQTKDSQYVNITMDVQYKVDSSTAFQVFREFRNLENVDKKLIANVVQRAVESVTTEYNVYDILGSAKNEVYAKIQEALKADLSEKGISFYYINFIDVDAGEAIEGAITAQAVAKQAVETAEQERQKAEIEAQKRVVEAQANLEKAKIEAETKLVEAQATADANALLEESLNEKILQKLWIEKWNGQLPKFVTDGDSMMIGFSGNTLE